MASILKILTLRLPDRSILYENTVEFIPEPDEEGSLEEKLGARVKKPNENSCLWRIQIIYVGNITVW